MAKPRLIAHAAVAALIAMPAMAGSPPSCKSIAKGSLDVELPAGQRSSRMVRLQAGDTMNFLVHSGASRASVTLVSGQGAPQVLLDSQTSGTATFTAPKAETYVFAIEAGDGNLAAVSVDCTRGNGSAASGAPPANETTGADRRSAFSMGFAEIAAAMESRAAPPLARWCDAGELAATVQTDQLEADDAALTQSVVDLHTRISSGAIGDVLDRIERARPEATTAGDGEPYQVAWAAALAPDLNFFPAVPHNVAAAGRPADRATPKAATQTVVAEAASSVADPSDAAEGWWVTYLQVQGDQSQHGASGEPERRPTKAASAFAPPMALGGKLPIDLPASETHEVVSTQ